MANSSKPKSSWLSDYVRGKYGFGKRSPDVPPKQYLGESQLDDPKDPYVKDWNDTYKGIIFDMAGKDIAKAVSSGKLKVQYVPELSSNGGPRAFFARNPNSLKRDLVGVGRNTGYYDVAHELAHYLWSRKSKKEQDKFQDDLLSTMRSANRSGISPLDLSMSLMNYENALAAGKYSGTTEDRINEWHSQIGSNFPMVSSMYEYGQPPFRKKAVVPDWGTRIYEKYPRLYSNFPGLFSDDYLRRMKSSAGPEVIQSPESAGY